MPLEQLQPKRMLMGGFPCYGRAPLRPGWDRVLQIGDAGAGQSPLSFGGFSSMVRLGAMKKHTQALSKHDV